MQTEIRTYKNGPVTVCVFACPRNDGGEVHIPTASGMCNVCKTTYTYSTTGLIALSLVPVPNAVTFFPVVTYASAY